MANTNQIRFLDNGYYAGKTAAWIKANQGNMCLLANKEEVEIQISKSKLEWREKTEKALGELLEKLAINMLLHGIPTLEGFGNSLVIIKQAIGDKMEFANVPPMRAESIFYECDSKGGRVRMSIKIEDVDFTRTFNWRNIMGQQFCYDFWLSVATHIALETHCFNNSATRPFVVIN